MSRFKHLFALYIMLLVVGNVIAQDTESEVIENDSTSESVVNN
mgnify:FL=1